MRLEEVLNHKIVTGGGIKLAQILPRWAGYGLAQLFASTVCRFQPALYHVVRSNLRQVLGAAGDEGILETTTRSALVHAGRANYDFFHLIGHSAADIARMVMFPPETIAQIGGAMAEGRGVLLLGTHMGNFNLAIPVLASLVDVPIQALSVADPNEGFTLLNHWRRRWGLEVTPISANSLRQAIRRLETGGVVLTAFDYPIHHNSTLIPFFGKPAYFPLGPARLARLTDAVVLLGYCHYEQAQGYTVRAQSIEVVRTQDRRQDVIVTAQRMAKVLEDYVAQQPDQWLMFNPFWPEGGEEGSQPYDNPERNSM